MRSAQLLSAVVYLLFVALATVLFRSDLGSDVTGIISMTKPVCLNDYESVPKLLTLFRE